LVYLEVNPWNRMERERISGECYAVAGWESVGP